MAKEPEHECGSCGYVASGYLRKELEEEGWVWHVVRGVALFIMCDSCEEFYEERRAETEALEKKGR